MPVPETVNVLLVSPRDDWAERVRSVDPSRLHVTTLPASDFADDEGAMYPPRWNADAAPTSNRDDRDQLLREAHVILLGLPYPIRLYSRTRDLQWVHHPNAGTSNLWESDFWGASVPVTSSRGSNYALPIAESVVAGALMLARGLHVGAQGSMRRRDYADNVTLAGKTMGIVGLGGIGGHVARLAKGFGMTILATRRSATERTRDIDGVDEVLPASELHDMLSRSDFVAICVMLTSETTGLLDSAAFAAMKPGALVINVARGEVIDEPAMIAALAAGRLGGAYLDVYAGELSGAPPPKALLADPRVVLTPHVSNVADEPGAVGIDLFLENVRNFLDGKPLRNVIDWSRGY
ncbi:MAG: NAD(P)-dependent oxidoreductase [Gammaproteobacteria bacterium]|nr:NAD(P)-dependent oxidoreductase [Gammaproteobacteria bacterium]